MWKLPPWHCHVSVGWNHTAPHSLTRTHSLALAHTNAAGMNDDSERKIDQRLQQVAAIGREAFQRTQTVVGRPVKPVDSQQQLVARFNAASRAVPAPVSEPESVAELVDRTHFVHQRAAPCYRPISELKKVDLAGLAWGAVHRGRYVPLRTLTPPRVRVSNAGSGLGALETVVEDERGAAVCLRVFNLDLGGLDADVQRWMPQGAVVLVLEPYCEDVEPVKAADGDVKRKSSTTTISSGVRVDHPSDLVFLRPGDPLVPKTWAKRMAAPVPGDVSADVGACEKLKEEGNLAFKARDYGKAIEKFVFFVFWSSI